MTLSELGTPVSIATLALALAGLIWKGGQLSMEVKKNDEKHDRDLKKLEEAHGREIKDLKTQLHHSTEHNITHGELDARFGEVNAKLEALKDRMTDVVEICKAVVKQ